VLTIVKTCFAALSNCARVMVGKVVIPCSDLDASWWALCGRVTELVEVDAWLGDLEN